ncbi:DUF58 domain-containing protein [Klebsiella sp. R390]|uniref:DUF58 domain-containing protein n=1 Tax=Klebsiella sp. R390 TaxID=2755400 RepID=UPI003DA93733
MNGQSGVYTSIDELLACEALTRQMRLSFSRLVHGLIQGNRPSRINGRGGAFDQVRQYQQGDDVRDIDWNVTARMRGTPFIRVFNEERERPMIIMVDQTNDMFFGTRLQLKSVLAVRISALLIWLTWHSKQPVGLIIAEESYVHRFPARHNKPHLIQLLEQLASANQSLSAQAKVTQAVTQLTLALQHLRHQISRNALVVIISDFHHFDAQAWHLMAEISAKTQVIALPVHDGIIHDWPTEGAFLATWGGIEAELRFSSAQQRHTIHQKTCDHFSFLQQHFTQSGVMSCPLTTWQSAERQLMAALQVQEGMT